MTLKNCQNEENNICSGILLCTIYIRDYICYVYRRLANWLNEYKTVQNLTSDLSKTYKLRLASEAFQDRLIADSGNLGRLLQSPTTAFAQRLKQDPIPLALPRSALNQVVDWLCDHLESLGCWPARAKLHHVAKPLHLQMQFAAPASEADLANALLRSLVNVSLYQRLKIMLKAQPSKLW